MSHGRLGFAVRKKVSASPPLLCVRAKPAKRHPILKPRGDLRQVEFRRARLLSKSMSHSLPESFAILDSEQQIVFVCVQTAKVDGIIHAVNGEKNARGF